jgi:multisubunit Na+/H+ antiporter MnhE subunit
MSVEIAPLLGILLAAMWLFARETFPADATALGALLALVIAGPLAA